MIISKIMGGLGNQLFQWAFGRALSLSLKDNQFYLDIAFYDNQHGVTPRSFELNKFENINYEAIRFDLSQQIYKFNTLNDTFDADKIFALLDCKKSDQSSLNYYLNGYWQSEKYFKEYKDIILNDLALEEKQEIILQKQIEPNSISLHVRRTDYVNLQHIHPVQPISYFLNAIDAIGDYNKLYIFSDDINWCKTNLKFNNMMFMEGRSGLEDMRLMSLCSNNIISNSSFSWWGAYLNKNYNKKVVAPTRWFGESAGLNTSDIVPEEWIKI